MTIPAPGSRRADQPWVWLMDLSVALVVSTIAASFVLGWWLDDACLDAGGRVLRGGADRLCEFSDGRREPYLPLTAAGWATLVIVWLTLTLTLYWAGRRFIGRRPG